MEQSQNRGQAVVYCRVSTSKQEDGLSLEGQADECRAHAEKLGYTVARVVPETHSGGELWKRPLLREVRDEIAAGRYQALVFEKWDRLARKQAHHYIIMEECERAKVEMICLREQYDDTPQGRFLRSAAQFVSEVEREKIRERCIDGRRRRAERGLIHRAGTPLYGYELNEERTKREINLDEARIVRQMYQWVLDGVSTRAIIRRLNAQDTPPPSAGKRNLVHKRYNKTPHWGGGAVRRILTEPSYKGESYAHRFKSSKTWRETFRPEEDWIKYPDDVTPAIVTREIWQAVQEKMKTNCGDQTRNEKRQDLLRGLIFCGVCESKLQGETEHGRRRIYRCGSRSKHTGHCGGRRVAADNCERVIWKKIVEILDDPQVITDELKRREQSGGTSRSLLMSDLETAQRKQKKLENELRRLVSRAASADDDLWQMFQEQIETKRRLKKQVETTIAEIEAQMAKDFNAVNALTELADYCGRVRANLATFGFNEKRLALEALGAKVIGNGRDWRLDFNLPLAGYSPTTFCSSARRVRARQCSPSVCRRFCRRSNLKPRWN